MKRTSWKDSTYLVLLVDRKKAKMFIMRKGVIAHEKEFFNGQVPKHVKHGDNAWDAQDKINRHIEDHLHRHLTLIVKKITHTIPINEIDFIILGGHKTLFSHVIHHLPLNFQQKIRGTFISELNIPIPAIAAHSRYVVEQLQEKDEIKRLEASLSQ